MDCLIAYNPYSGKEKFIKHKDYVINRLKEKFARIDVFCSDGEKSITRKIKEYGSFYKCVIVCGGDGTLNEAINGLMLVPEPVRPILAYLPFGTVNDVGHMLGLNKNIKKIINDILALNYVNMDVCRLNDKYFTYAAATGKFTSVSYEAKKSLKKHFGRMAYFLEAFKRLKDKEKIKVQINVNGKNIEESYYVVLALNSKQLAGFNLYRRKPIKLNDGIIDLTLVKTKRFNFSFINLGMFFLFGDHWKKGITSISTNSFKIISENELAFNVDGELAFNSSVAECVVINKAIKIVVPKKTKKKYF